MIRYEHPLNERIRTLMRLEDLFARAQYFTAKAGAPDHHAALLALFEITDVASRADLKTDILQELERQRQLLAPLRSPTRRTCSSSGQSTTRTRATSGSRLPRSSSRGTTSSP